MAVASVDERQNSGMTERVGLKKVLIVQLATVTERCKK